MVSLDRQCTNNEECCASRISLQVWDLVIFYFRAQKFEATEGQSFECTLDKAIFLL